MKEISASPTEIAAQSSVFELFVDRTSNRKQNKIEPVDLAPGNAAYRGVTLQMLPHGDILPVGVVLGTIAHLLEGVRLVNVNILTANLRSAPRH